MTESILPRKYGEESAKDFAEEVRETIKAALPVVDSDLVAEFGINESNGIIVLSMAAPLFYGRGTISAQERNESKRSELYGLVVEYKLTHDRDATFLTVRNSAFEIRVHTQSAIKFEYEREKTTAPAAHIHFSGIGGLLSPALMKNGKKGKSDTRKDGNLKALHLPVGGHRFRPSLEDFLYFTIEECGFSGNNGWQNALKKSRDRWFDIQLRAAVRDNPAEAMKALEGLGFNVTPPKDGCPEPRRHTSW